MQSSTSSSQNTKDRILGRSFDSLSKRGDSVTLPQISEFWQFVAERQNIWYKRNVLKLPAPWTDDPILARNHFTNIYRELDYGTQWYVRNIGDKIGNKYLTEILWYTIVYRLLNSANTFMELGYLPTPDDVDYFIIDLQRLKDNGFPIFSTAYITLQTPIKRSRIGNFHEMLRSTFDFLFSYVLPLDLRGFCRDLTNIYGINWFNAYEVACDVLLLKQYGIIDERKFPFEFNDWANVGPGALAGCKLLFGLSVEKDEAYEKMRWLLDRQEEGLAGLEWHPFYAGQPLNLRHIEHSLCEYQKYWKLKNNVGKFQRIFSPANHIEKPVTLGRGNVSL